MNTASAFQSQVALIERHCLVRSDDIDDVRDRTSRILKPHDLWLVNRNDKVRAEMHGTTFGNLSVSLLTYGADVEIDPGSFDRFLTIQIPISGSARLWLDDEEIAFSTGQGVIIAPDRRCRLTYSADCRQLILRVSRETLERVAEGWMGARVRGGDLAFDPRLVLDGAAGASWNAMIAYLMSNSVARDQPRLSTKFAPRLEELVVEHLLVWQPNGISDRIAAGPSPIPRHVRRAEELMRADTSIQLTLSEIAQHAGVSVRSLSQGFQQFRGVTPMAMLRAIRLEKVRADLLSAQYGASVTDIATRHGFSHLGRFAGFYRKRFGESPRRTLDRRK
jgi:AraC-like DNA-binding protein